MKRIQGAMVMTQRHLHITNGDSAAATLRKAGIPGDILPWRDILHDGPVPSGLNLEQLSEVRARFLAQPGMPSFQAIWDDFQARDRTLQDFRRYDQVTLWLEHDLYDQLQLLQLLDWFSQTARGTTALCMICIDRFPGIEPFYGLGQLDATQMASLWGQEQAISEQQLALGRRGWLAFTAATPYALLDYLESDLSALPFLKSALFRHLEEFPASRSGLTRHERQILELVEAGISQPLPLFTQHQQRETAPYLGDWGYWNLLEQLTNTPNALLQTQTRQPFQRPPSVPADADFQAQQLSLTAHGRAVLDGEADWVELNPPDYWKGGVHLHPDKTIWRWNGEQKRLTI